MENDLGGIIVPLMGKHRKRPQRGSYLWGRRFSVWITNTVGQEVIQGPQAGIQGYRKTSFLNIDFNLEIIKNTSKVQGGNLVKLNSIKIYKGRCITMKTNN